MSVTSIFTASPFSLASLTTVARHLDKSTIYHHPCEDALLSGSEGVRYFNVHCQFVFVVAGYCLHATALILRSVTTHVRLFYCLVAKVFVASLYIDSPSSSGKCDRSRR